MAEGNRNFHDFLSPNNIVCRSKAADGRELLVTLLDILKRHFPELDRDCALREVMAREELFPTLIAPGLAVPHARLPGLAEPLVAMGLSQEGVAFGSPEDDPVRVMILVLTPEDDPNLHMQLLAALAMDFSQPDAIGTVSHLATPAEVIAYFSGNLIAIADYLTAGDVMRENIPTLKETDPLRHAIAMFATSQAEEIPVLDREGDLRGVVALRDLLQFSLPEHLLWMEDLSPIYRFQPFADMLKSSGDTRIADVMREEFLKVDRDVPAIQLAKLFLVHHLRQLVITGKDGRLAGVVELKEFCAKLFWE